MRTLPNLALAGMAALALGLAGCTVHSLDNSVFGCQDDNECASDEVCLEGICRSPSSLADGGPIIGHCAADCSADRKMCCDTECVDLASDDKHCGDCSTVCANGESCVAGKCTTETSCDNNRDDNGDGLTDCEDTTSCPEKTPCANGGRCCANTCALEGTDELCSNGRDDDCNEQIDCDDTACTGRRCAAGSVCDSTKTCAAGCFIDGKFVAPNTANPEAACQVCNPAQNIHDWSAAAAGSMTDGCKGTRACNDAGNCRRASGQPCGSTGDCASKTCAAGICL